MESLQRLFSLAFASLERFWLLVHRKRHNAMFASERTDTPGLLGAAPKTNLMFDDQSDTRAKAGPESIFQSTIGANNLNFKQTRKRGASHRVAFYWKLLKIIEKFWTHKATVRAR